ncbi:MAG: Crp/Fnr family transcriptional regulator [Burkholderiaceae bacterium]
MRTVSRHASDPFSNQLLAALPAFDWQRWQAHIEEVELPVGQVLAEPGRPMAHAYFPTTAAISLLYVTAAGESVETGLVGDDGMVGIALFMGGDTMPNRAVVHGAGRAYRLPAQLLRAEAGRGGAVLVVLLRYAQSLIAQLSQMAACNRHHSIDQRVARRLLVELDRMPGNSMHMTQELLAGLLGVRREGVTAAALKLQLEGVIRYRRGHIDVLDRPSLAVRSCECYAVSDRSCRQRLLPQHHHRETDQEHDRQVEHLAA